MKAENIHYVWIGDPPSKSELVGQDVLGPMRMAKATEERDHPVFFWCLQNNLKHYEERFSKHANIKVVAVDEVLSKISPDDPLYKISELFFKILKQETITTRDKVNLKNLSSLLILAVEGGYFADTNVQPNPEQAINLSSYEQARITVMSEFPNGYNLGDYECFLMYAPKNSVVANAMLQTYYENLTALTNNPEEKIKIEEYHKKCGAAIIGAIVFALRDAGIDVEELGNNFYGDASERDRTLIIIKELGLIKRYDNTHHLKKATEPPLNQVVNQSLVDLREAIKTNDMGKVEALINATPTLLDHAYDHDGIIGETPLHYAICLGKKDVVSKLGEMGADTTLKAFYPKINRESKLTPPELGNELEYEDFFAKSPTSTVFKQKLSELQHDESQENSPKHI